MLLRREVVKVVIQTNKARETRGCHRRRRLWQLQLQLQLKTTSYRAARDDDYEDDEMYLKVITWYTGTVCVCVCETAK